MPNYFENTNDDDLFSNIWNSIKDKIIWREREPNLTNEDDPLDFSREVFENILPFPFHDANLKNPELSERLEIEDSDSASKFQLVCIAVTLFLIKRALREALVVKFGSSYKNIEMFTRMALEADAIADGIIDQQLKQNELSNYANLNYFLRWNRRYHEAAAASTKTKLLETTLNCALQHATFSYEDENAVVAADELMLIEFNRIFGAYVHELRNMLGEQCLH